ncbi:MAG: DUF4159 domain-containing protein [Elusimicrobia bacterium]|nr:DUF4159 domain-containing protein [Elusimicrobiota bacterium]MBD3411519.1 DUF4159 domain-containing protein [Elusimicrobiota bacterium]
MQQVKKIHSRLWMIIMLIMGSVMSMNVCAEQDNRFRYAQVRYNGGWDPYPDIHYEILSFMVTTTSIQAISERAVVELGSDDLFEYPFVILLGNTSFPSLTKKEQQNLRHFIEAGGVIFVEDATGVPASSFDRSFRREIRQVFDDASLAVIPREHAVLRSFYLMRTIPGRKIIHNYYEGIEVDGRTGLIYSQNDILGTWARDRLGNYLYMPEPGGELQRKESIKMTANIILFGLTGTYKTDAIHIPFILRKLRSHPYER